MGEPHVPGAAGETFKLPCGHRLRPDTFDMGMREFHCPCGDVHAVAMDVHPLGRWIPESIEQILATVIDPADEHERFGTIHVMGMVLEEFPDQVATHDSREDPSTGWRLLWVTAFDARRLHEVIVELLVELMDHAVGHTDDSEVHASFADQLDAFDVTSFVEEYRAARELEDVGDRAT